MATVLDGVMWLLTALCGLVLAFLLCMIGISVGDSITATPHAGTGTVIAKEYHEPYTSVMLVGKVPVVQNHPSRWSLCFRVDGIVDDTDCVDVRQHDWVQATEGARFDIDYALGGITQDLIIREIRPIHPALTSAGATP